MCLSTSLTRSYEGDDEVLLDDEAETEALWTWRVSLNASLLPSLHLASWAFLALCFSFAWEKKKKGLIKSIKLVFCQCQGKNIQQFKKSRVPSSG